MPGLIELLIILFVFVLNGLTLWGIISAATFDEHAWRAIGGNKTLWIVLPLLLGPFAAIPYLASVRPKLKAVGQLPPPGPP